MPRATAASRKRTIRPPRRRRTGIWLLATLVTLVALWLAYWYGASQIAAAVVDRANAAAAARGYSLVCADAAGGGFPLSLDLTCSRASLAGGAGPLSATVDGVAASAPLYVPGRLAWRTTGPFVLDAPQSRLGLTATWSANESRVDAGLDGLTGVTTRIEGLRIHLLPDRRLTDFAGASAARTTLAIAPASGDDYRLTASADAFMLETDDGRNLPEIDVDAEIAALAFGDSLGLDPRRAFADWIAGGGSLRIDRLVIGAGAVATSTTGTLDFAPDGRLSGTLKVNIAGVETLPDLVENFRPGSREKVAQIAAAIVAFTRPVDTPSGPTRELQLLIRDNVVSIGIIPIGIIPPLNF